jgi:tetratricopeptide (TPR) repeat protein
MLTLDVMLPALVVFALSLVGGAVIAVVLRKRAPVEPMRDTLDDADEKVSRLMAHLRELALQEGRIDAETYAKERNDLESQAAQALRARDELNAPRKAAAAGAVAAAPTKPSSPLVAWLHARPAMQGALWASAVFVVAGSLFYFVQRDQQPGSRPPPGQAPMEGPGEQAGMPPPDGQPRRVEMPPFITAELPTDGEVQALIAKMQADPRDMKAMVRLGHLLLAARMFEETKILTDRALQFDPANVEALTHAAALKSVQDREAGLSLLDKLLKTQPKLAEAWLFRGMIGLHSGDTALMQDSFQKFVALSPDGPERQHVKAMLERTSQTPTAKP